ncbi:MAG: hypothetical protein COB66_03605 [Coxiella sp. (in: Bacteria)]|nr:MAG: hypothetical protein COB66_03605 [Coxiella sp. (in: g-proteobacteria)]
MQLTEKHKFAGFGIGLRPVHYDDILSTSPDVDWFEVLSEDYLVAGGAPLAYLDQICERYPVAMHGVSLSIGSTDPLNWDYLKRLKQLMQRVKPMWLSDHCCWTGVDQVNLHDLMPLPYTDEAIKHTAVRIKEVQDFLERPLVLENVSSYIAYQDSQMSEWQFLNALCAETGCLLLLDINNIYVSAFNHGFNPMDYVNGINADVVQQFHLAGHKHCDTYIIDTHDDEIINAVWRLYRCAIERFGAVSTLIERDANIPPLAVMLKELDQARTIYQSVTEAQVA